MAFELELKGSVRTCEFLQGWWNYPRQRQKDKVEVDVYRETENSSSSEACVVGTRGSE